MSFGEYNKIQKLRFVDFVRLPQSKKEEYIRYRAKHIALFFPPVEAALIR